MPRLTVGLDFGTHQTKICVEDKSDVNNPIYTFFSFTNINGEQSVIFPSIVQINEDDTLSYGFVDKGKCKYGSRNTNVHIEPKPEFQHFLERVNTTPLPPKPKKPDIFLQDTPKNVIQAAFHIAKLKKVELEYNKKLKEWEKAISSIHEENNRKVHCLYELALKEWEEKSAESIKGEPLCYRYFKQATFSKYNWDCSIQPRLLSIWYISFLLFKLEEKYGNDFAIQMGIPTGADNFEQKKQLAVSILLSAYHLVEEIFNNEIETFLATPINELEKLTEFIPYSREKKFEFGLLVFPEAFAALKSLTAQKRIQAGMSLMVDIGGGTTDVSFFTIENDKPSIYNYTSIPYGINYILEQAIPNNEDRFNVSTNLNKINKAVLNKATAPYKQKLKECCANLTANLYNAFSSTGFPSDRLTDALKDRIIIYSGGGSTYSTLRLPISPFTDVKVISSDIWKGMTIDEISDMAKICPIISTSFGLAISENHDNVQVAKLNKIFAHIQYIPEEEPERPRPRWV